jgi:hypothetical protein
MVQQNFILQQLNRSILTKLCHYFRAVPNET